MALEIKENEILANHSTFRIGGPARYFVAVKSKEELAKAIAFAKSKELPFFVLGGGSNVLFGDDGFNGVVIISQISNLKSKNCNVVAGSGVLLAKLINFSIENDLTGLEWGMGIPGTVGGAVAGNCGAYGHSISEFVKSVTVLDENGNVKNYPAKECGFVYRGSRFKKRNPPRRAD
ncbi:MAG: FAD-binding protein [bacterium]|nr:FAD-binding protein [bacterium]